MYLTGKSYKIISETKAIIYAEKEWKYLLFTLKKEVEYTCTWTKEIFSGDDGKVILTSNMKYFNDKGEPTTGYEEHCLDLIGFKISRELETNYKEIKKQLRKKKLERLENVVE